MLIQFNFKNFKSFKDDTVLDLSATKITEFNNHVINIGEEKILPIAAIFGANASGKSNVHQAFRYMCNYVINSFGFGGDNQDKNNAFIPPTPFLFDNTSKNDSSSFEVYFITDENDKYKTYNYGFCVDKQGVKEEWLNSKAKTAKKYKNIFYRNREEDELILDGISSKNHENIRIALENEALVVSLGAKLKIQCLKKIRDWFLKHEVADFGNPLENFLLSRFIPEGFDEDEEVRKNVINYFSSFDESIVDFKVEKITDGEGKEHINVDALHKVIGSDALEAIPLREESAGTLKMFSLYSGMKSILDNGGIFFVDELNSRLHPLLVRNFLVTFIDSNINKNHAQIIFTTHDTWSLSNDMLRRDEIWFVEKDKNGASHLYSLVDFQDVDGDKIRKDENYEKNYLLGKYGAIPELKTISMCRGK